MANKYRGEVTIDLDRRRTLKFNHNALVALEEQLGVISYFEWFNTLRARGESAIGIKEVRALIWAGLLHENPELKLEDVGNLMDQAGGKDERDNPTAQFLYLQSKAFTAFFSRVLPKESVGKIQKQLEDLSAQAKETIGENLSKALEPTESALASSGTS